MMSDDKPAAVAVATPPHSDDDSRYFDWYRWGTLGVAVVGLLPVSIYPA
jgi:hypothetical protein